VEDADCGENALIAVEENNPNVVLLDIRLPGMDGITTLKRIKEKNPETQVVMISGFATINIAKQSLEFGAFDYISKPLNFNHLKNVIQQIKLSKYLDSL
jgi:YesN/AraC family two-component response regulator